MTDKQTYRQNFRLHIKSKSKKRSQRNIALTERMGALSVLKPTEREILEGNKLALTSSDQSPINCEKEKHKTSKN